MRRVLILILCIFMPGTGLLAQDSQGSRKVYKSVGEQGEVEFSDVPRSGAERITVPPANVVAPPVVPKAEAEADTPPPDIFKYTALVITSPPHEHTFTDGSGNADVSVQVTPPVESRLGHQLEVVIDGAARAINGTGMKLANLDRGEHNVQARVVDRDGNELIRSDVVTFFVQRPTVFGPGNPIGPGPGPGGP